MKTILQVLDMTHMADEPTEMMELIDDEIVRCTNAGDLLGAGEWLASKLPYADEDEFEDIFCKMVAMWASPLELKVLPSYAPELALKLDEFVPEELAVSLVASTWRLLHFGHSLQSVATDLTFRLSEPISQIFGVETRRPGDLCKAAAAKLEVVTGELLSAIDAFIGTKCVTAKIASIEVVKKSHQLKRLALAEERPILSEIDVLLGPTFRKFCESCERHETKRIIRRIPDLKEQAQRCISLPGHRSNSTLWNLTVAQIARHVVQLVDEASRKTEAAITPSLKLATNEFKLDLSRLNREITFSCRLVNSGEGHALKVTVEPDLAGLPIELKILEPKAAFDMATESEQILTFAVIFRSHAPLLDIPLEWKCTTLTGRGHVDADSIMIHQQRVQPDWDSLMQDPPYSINPIKNRENLFGRDTVLKKLLLHAYGGTSTFLWGQKRVGKTSVLQVLASELEKKETSACVVLRMGELAALHEGQIAYTIAERLHQKIGKLDINIPTEQEFGAGLSKLIPFFENMVHECPDAKFIVIIDEFDDIDPAFYTGQRGKLFVKALRSLSEIGLTFFFVGSERMGSIYTKHAVDLNKWVDVYLDCIESIEDCKDLVVHPVVGAIEYQPECVDFVVDYCRGNPFYMHLFCSEVFKRSWQDQRTYVSESDLHGVRQSLIRFLGETNFSHFWDDNPIIDEPEKAEKAAENCLVLSCISALGGSFESVDDIYFPRRIILALGFQSGSRAGILAVW